MVSKYSAVPGPRLGALGSGAVGLMIHCDRCKTRNFMPIGRALHLWGVRTCLRDIAKDVKCSRCGGREAAVTVEYRRLEVVRERKRDRR